MNIFSNFRQTGRKIEFAQFCVSMGGIVESNSPEDLKIVSSLNKYLESLPLADELKIRSTKLPLTNEQKALLKKLDKSASVLLRYSKVKTKQNGTDTQDETGLYEFIGSYYQGYSSKNSYQKTSIISKMLTSFEANPEFVQAAEMDGLTPIIAKLKADYTELDLLIKSRRKGIAKIEKIRTAKIKRSLYFLLRELLTSIELAILTNPTVNYGEMINELNQEISRFNAGSKPQTRKTEGDVILPEVPTVIDATEVV